MAVEPWTQAVNCGQRHDMRHHIAALYSMQEYYIQSIHIIKYMNLYVIV